MTSVIKKSHRNTGGFSAENDQFFTWLLFFFCCIAPFLQDLADLLFGWQSNGVSGAEITSENESLY